MTIDGNPPEIWQRVPIMKHEAQAVPGCIQPEAGASLEAYLQRKLTAKDEQAFEEHYFACQPCLDEIKLRQALPDALRSADQRVRRHSRPWWLSAAAGLALLVLGYPAWLGVVELPKARQAAVGMAADQSRLQETVQGLRERIAVAEARLSSLLDWSGPADLVVLSPPTRDQATERVLTLAAGQPHALLMVVPPDVNNMSADATLDFSVTGPDGSVVWSRGLRGQEIRSRVGQSGAVTFLLPARVLPDGSCRLLIRAGSADGPERMNVSFQVVHQTAGSGSSGA